MERDGCQATATTAAACNSSNSTRRKKHERYDEWQFWRSELPNVEHEIELFARERQREDRVIIIGNDDDDNGFQDGGRPSSRDQPPLPIENARDTVEHDEAIELCGPQRVCEYVDDDGGYQLARAEPFFFVGEPVTVAEAECQGVVSSLSPSVSSEPCKRNSDTAVTGVVGGIASSSSVAYHHSHFHNHCRRGSGQARSATCQNKDRSESSAANDQSFAAEITMGNLQASGGESKKGKGGLQATAAAVHQAATSVSKDKSAGGGSSSPRIMRILGKTGKGLKDAKKQLGSKGQVSSSVAAPPPPPSLHLPPPPVAEPSGTTLSSPTTVGSCSSYATPPSQNTSSSDSVFVDSQLGRPASESGVGRVEPKRNVGAVDVSDVHLNWGSPAADIIAPILQGSSGDELVVGRPAAPPTSTSSASSVKLHGDVDQLSAARISTPTGVQPAEPAAAAAASHASSVDSDVGCSATERSEDGLPLGNIGDFAVGVDGAEKTRIPPEHLDMGPLPALNGGVPDGKTVLTSPPFTVTRHKKISLASPGSSSSPATPLASSAAGNSSSFKPRELTSSEQARLLQGDDPGGGGGGYELPPGDGLRRHMSFGDVPFAEQSNVLRKVASLTLDRATIEEKVRKPKFVPETLDFAIYEKFEGQMLINWFCTAFVDGHYLYHLLNKQDMKIVAAQFCTHLLACGVLRQIEDAEAPLEPLFRPDLMYFWAHSAENAANSTTPLPGKLQSPAWPPPVFEGEPQVRQQQAPPGKTFEPHGFGGYLLLHIGQAGARLGDALVLIFLLLWFFF